MAPRYLAGIFAAAVVMLVAGLSPAADSGHVESLDGMPSVTIPPSEAKIRTERRPLLSEEFQPSPLVIPRGSVSPLHTTPFNAPLPPNQLTPAPVLPFNPNRSLMPSPSSPPPSSGNGRLGR